MLNLAAGLPLETAVSLILNGLLESFYMTFAATVFAYALGLPLGVILYATGKKGISPNRLVYSVLGFIVNLLRSVPFLILLVTIIPFTRAIVGTFIGSTAAIVPLTVAAFPFVARMVESSLTEIDGGKIEAGQSMGTGNFMLIVKVLLPESLPSLIINATITITTILSYSAMAGFVAGGGLGSVAVQYGFQRYDTVLMFVCVALLFAIVQLFQFTGNFLSKKLDKRKR